MKYVKHFDILGVDTAQVPCIELQGVPNAATVGAVGLLGMDMTSEGHEIYKCVAVNGSVYTWECLTRGKDGTSVVKVDIVGDDLVLTLSDGTEINAGRVKGADGRDGVNGANGKDGCEITNITISDKNELLVEMSSGKVINAGVLPTVKGDAGVSVVKAEFNNKGELVLTLSSGELLTVGHAIPTIQDLFGKESIGDEFHYLYYDGEKLVARAVSIKDETTEWAQIALMSEQISKGEKTPEELGLAVGQEKTVTLTTGEEVTFVILGFNHDDLADGSGKAGITFGMRDLLATKYLMVNLDNEELGIACNWGTSLIKEEVLPNIYSALPSTLKENIKEVKKVTRTGSTSTQYLNTRETLFLFSDTEVGAYTDSKGGSPYAYYSSADERIKYTSNGKGALSDWWVRNLYGYDNGNAWYYYTNYLNRIGDRESETSRHYDDGSWGMNELDLSIAVKGICFGFCI